MPHRPLLRWSGVAVGLVLGGVGVALVEEGWWALLGIPLFVAGMVLAQYARTQFRTNDRRARRRDQMGAAIGLLVFFAAAGAFVAWVALSPNGGCADCDGPWALPTVVAINVGAWAFGGLLVWNAWKHPAE